MESGRVRFADTVVAVKPRIGLHRSFDQLWHSYRGYVLVLDDGTRVAVGAGAHAKHRFRIGDVVEGEGLPLPDPEPSDLPPLVRLALIHYQFEAIHPFLDGNGRVGRLLISVVLHEWELLPQPLLYLSAFFQRRRGDYYDLLFDVSRQGAWEP